MISVILLLWMPRLEFPGDIISRAEFIKDVLERDYHLHGTRLLDKENNQAGNTATFKEMLSSSVDAMACAVPATRALELPRRHSWWTCI